ncbi:hypothetical protein NI17_015880 [Thermobifida halotolerans]|uniref:Uncharacterized protein n=1 Tax=Thermobifida halotolerans TaxID=483545 RepID=A0A399G455_9ACTN|nr:hypothetical protein [Thermobifida halotolerans]UOE18305.1 hypothetical protein NI17_015880 [Thermobifida halotolerans]
MPLPTLFRLPRPAGSRSAGALRRGGAAAAATAVAVLALGGCFSGGASGGQDTADSPPGPSGAPASQDAPPSCDLFTTPEGYVARPEVNAPDLGCEEVALILESSVSEDGGDVAPPEGWWCVWGDPDAVTGAAPGELVGECHHVAGEGSISLLKAD